MFKLSPDDRVTTDQLNYVLMMSKPSNYIVANHTIRGNPITFNIPDHNINRALAHRPFQVGILNDTYQDVIIIKSRQLSGRFHSPDTTKPAKHTYPFLTNLTPLSKSTSERLSF